MTELEKAADRIAYLYGKILSLDGCDLAELDELLDLTGQEGFVCGKLSTKQSPWISVEERLPEKDGTRVWVKSSCLNHQPLIYHKGKFYARLSDGAYDGSVTHWMNIPE